MWRASEGSVAGAVFGLVYLVVNAGTCPRLWARRRGCWGWWPFLVVLVAVVRARPAPMMFRTHMAGFGRGYWKMVAVEVIVIATGVAVLGGPLYAPQAGVAWVFVIVGVKFFPLAAIFGEPFFRSLGAAVAARGVMGLVSVAAGARAALVAALAESSQARCYWPWDGGAPTGYRGAAAGSSQ